MSLSKLIVTRRLSFPFFYRIINRYQSTVPLKQDIDQLTGSGSNPRPQPLQDIPGPKELPFIGSFHWYMLNGGHEQTHKIHQQMFEEFGPIFKASLFGQTMVHVTDPNDWQTVYRSEGKYPKRLAINSLSMAYMEKNVKSFALSDGDEWKYLRRAVQPKTMRPKELYGNIDNFNAVVDDALQSIGRVRGAGKSEGEVPNLEDELATWATESIGTFVFDTRIGLYDDPPNEDAEEFIKAVQTLFECMHNLELSAEKMFYKKFNTPSIVKLRNTVDIMRSIGRKKLDAKMKELKDDLDNPENLMKPQVVPLLSYLLAKQELNQQEIIDSAIDMFVGGVDTTSVVLAWGLYRLATNQDVQERVHKEIISVIGKDGCLTVKEMAKIPYMKAFLKEMLRLDGIAPFNIRILDDNITLRGFNIPAGTPIVMDMYTTNRSENYVKDGKKFRPERWLRDTDDKMHPYTSLPFGFGPRMCIGKRTAELELMLFLSKVVQKFKLEYYNEPVKKKTAFILRPDRKMLINFIDRN